MDYFKSAQTAGYDRDDCNIGIAEVYRYTGRPEESMNLLGQHLRTR
ncbi:MAG: hypothetical protein U0892_23555 [Pirellulales bacterium]